MKGKLRVIIVLVMLGALLVPTLAFAQEDTGGACVIVQGPTRTDLGIIGPSVTVGGVHSVQITGPQINFGGNDISTTPQITLPAVQYPPSPCLAN